MFALSAIQIVVTTVVFLVGSVVFGTVGFGIGVTTIPILLTVLDPQTVVVVVNTVSLGLFTLVIFQTRHHLRVGEIVPVTAAGLAGVPVGVFFLSSANVSLLRISITAAILILTGVAVFNVGRALPRSKALGPAVGFVVAVLLTSLGIGGALMALFALTRDWERHAVRGSLALYFLVIEGTGVVGYGVAGLFTQERLTLIAVVAVPVALGFALSVLIHRRMNEIVFRRALLTVIVSTSLVVLIRELIAL